MKTDIPYTTAYVDTYRDRRIMKLEAINAELLAACKLALAEIYPPETPGEHALANAITKAEEYEN